MPRLGNLLKAAQEHAAHLALVVFVGTEDIRVFDADEGGQPWALRSQKPPPEEVLVEDLLRIAVFVEGAELVDGVFIVLESSLAVAVCRGGGCVDHPDVSPLAVFRQELAAVEVVVDEV